MNPTRSGITGAQGRLASVSASPYGGASGYTSLVMDDSFGSSKSGANITSLSQLNPGTAYGKSGSGWDDHMCAWDCNKANLAMASDHLEIYPTGGGSGFISSHFEYKPTGNQRVYYEIRATTGRGDLSGAWPAFWLFAGNEPGSRNTKSEFDIMETYMDQSNGNYDSSAGGYDQYFQSTAYSDGASRVEGATITTPGIDITTSYNIYGCEVYAGSDELLYFNLYFNGKLVKSTSNGVSWGGSAPTLLLGWNPKSSSRSNAVMKVDYVRAWVMNDSTIPAGGVGGSSGGSSSPSYALSISSPAQNASVSGVFNIVGSGPGFLNIEVYNSAGARLAQVTPSSSGDFTASVDSSGLTSGPQLLTIYGWDSPAGQNFSHSDQMTLAVNVMGSGGGSTSDNGVGSSGGSPSSTLNPYSPIDAMSFSAQSGVSVDSAGVVGYFDNGNWLQYSNLNFSSGLAGVTFTLAEDPSYAGSSIEVRADSVSGTLLGTLRVGSTGGWGTFINQSIALSNLSGTHNVFLVGKGGYGIANLKSLVFLPSSNTDSSAGGATIQNYTLTIGSPAQNAAVSDTVQVTGMAPGFQNVEFFNPSGAWIARTTPSSSGAFFALIDTSKLGSGSQTLTIDAWDSPAGQAYNHKTETKLTLNVQSSSSTNGGSTSGGNTGNSPGSSAGGSSYALTISSPAQNANVNGTFQVSGTGPGFLNVEIYDASGNRVAQATPDSSGAFTASVDSTRLANGSQTLTIDGWDSPAGQAFNHTDEKKLTVSVQNASSGGTSNGGNGGASSGGTIPFPGTLTNLRASDAINLSGQSGATISGLKISNPNGPCITVSNSSNITITGNEIGPCKTGVLVNNGASNVTVKGNYIHDTVTFNSSDYTGNFDGPGVNSLSVNNITVSYNYFADTTTAYHGAAGSNLVFDHNYVVDVHGNPDRNVIDRIGGQMAQIEGSKSPIRVTCNISDQSSGHAWSEDHLNLWQSQGTASTPILVAYNKVRGAGPSISNGGLLAGDAKGDPQGNYITIDNNNVISSGGYGVAIAGGYGSILSNNKIYGRVSQVWGKGIYVKDFSSTPNWGGHAVINNKSNFRGTSGGGEDIDSNAVVQNSGNVYTQTDSTTDIFGDGSGWTVDKLWNEPFSACQ